MAEIGIVASIIGVAGAAATIAKGLYQIASEIGSAGKEVRLIAQDTNAFSQVLTTLSQMLNGGTANTERARIIVKDLIVLCQEILDDSKVLLRVLQPLIKLTGKKWKRGALRFRWLLDKSKFAIHRQSLEAMKATLTLLVATMTYVDASSARVPAVIGASLKSQLESVREELKLNAHEYEPLLLQIQENVQAIRSDAIKAYSMIGNSQVQEEPARVQSQDIRIAPKPDQPSHMARLRTDNQGIVNMANQNSLPVGRSRTGSPALNDDDSEDLAVPVTALVVHTGLPGLPYLQRQALHLADDVLDSSEEALTGSAALVPSQSLTKADPVWKRNTSFEDAIEELLDMTSEDQVKTVDEPSRTTDLVKQDEANAREKRRWENARVKYTRMKKEALGKIAFGAFKVGDLALFLPTRNQSRGSWAAFNMGAPHYFLHEDVKFGLHRRDWMIGRIVSIDRREVNLDTPGGREDNPFELSDGLVWHLIHAEEEVAPDKKVAAPAAASSPPPPTGLRSSPAHPLMSRSTASPRAQPDDSRIPADLKNLAGYQ